MHLLVRRDALQAGYTLGSLFVDGVFECFTLEDEVREGPKIFGDTAIPAGAYQIIINQSVRFKRELPLLLNVPNFTGVRIHAGNTAADTEGCILVGTTRGPGYINQSRLAFSTLFAKMLLARSLGQAMSISITDELAARAVA